MPIFAAVDRPSQKPFLGVPRWSVGKPRSRSVLAGETGLGKSRSSVSFFGISFWVAGTPAAGVEAIADSADFATSTGFRVNGFEGFAGSAFGDSIELGGFSDTLRSSAVFDSVFDSGL